MNDQKSRLDRTALKYFGNYLLSGDQPGRYVLEHTETEEEMLSILQKELEGLLRGMERTESNHIVNTATALGAAYERAGFYSGVKVGVRLLLSLTDNRDILF